MRRILLAVGLATTISIAVPIVALAAPDTETQQAQAGPADEHGSERLGGGPGHWMRGQAGPMMGGWRGRMMHRMANRVVNWSCNLRRAAVSQGKPRRSWFPQDCELNERPRRSGNRT